jgi:hypothetical protein
MIQQKSAELLFSINVTKRTLKELEKVIAQATHAQKYYFLFSDQFKRLIQRLIDYLRP